MKSVAVTSEGWAGIPSDADALTLADEKLWCKTQDIQCLPAVVATLKGLRKSISVTAIAVKTSAGDAVGTATELSISAGASLAVKIAFTPSNALYDVTWASGDATKVKVTKIDDDTALIEPVAANSSAITITATAGTGVTGTCSIKPVA